MDMGVSSEDAAKKFDRIDKNNTGKISQSDMRRILKKLPKMVLLQESRLLAALEKSAAQRVALKVVEMQKVMT